MGPAGRPLAPQVIACSRSPPAAGRPGPWPVRPTQPRVQQRGSFVDMTARLHYFRGRGNSQQPRWALAAAGIPFESAFLITASDFAALRASGSLTYGQVPMLEDGEHRLSQSLTIVRHCARRGGLYGVNDSEASRIDEVIDGIKDARGPLVGYPFGDPREACARLAGAAERFFPCFEELIRKNGSPPFVVGAALTMADVLLAELLDSTQEAFEATFGSQAAVQVLEPYPQLRTLHAHVVSLPAIKQFKASANWMPFPAGAIGRAYVENVRTAMA